VWNTGPEQPDAEAKQVAELPVPEVRHANPGSDAHAGGTGADTVDPTVSAGLRPLRAVFPELPSIISRLFPKAPFWGPGFVTPGS
jgi:hypothetical protein